MKEHSFIENMSTFFLLKDLSKFIINDFYYYVNNGDSYLSLFDDNMHMRRDAVILFAFFFTIGTGKT